jgi:hypothetical protein
VSRLSEASEEFNFSQNIAPVPSVTISNTWALASDNTPDLSPTRRSRFNNSPLIGISGYFSKTAQFGPAYSKNLDVSTTKFRIQYKVDDDDWRPVTRAVLRQKLVTDTIAYRVDDLINRSVTVSLTGEYNNIVPTTPEIGTSQEPIVFYIPQDQGNGNAFTESNKVQVKITIVDTANMWAGVNSSPKESEKIQLINRINTYSFIGGTPALVVANSVKSLEPWNSQNDAYYDSDNGVLHVKVNDSIIQAPKSNVKADSNNIIQELDQGWKIVNTGVNTNGAIQGRLPKVNLYSYGNVVPAAQQNPSNSFTLSQINGMGAYAVIDQHQGALEYPFFVVYTTPSGSNNRASWYKSSLLYAPSLSGNTTTDSSRAGPTLLYTGTDNLNFFPEIPSNRRVKMVINLQFSDTNGNYDDTEKVNLVTVQTSSNANTSQTGSFNFTISETGLSSSSSVLRSLTMRFTTNLVLNIPVVWDSIHAHSVNVNYHYNQDPPKPLTFNYADLPAIQGQRYLSLFVKPTSATTLSYTVAYIVNNTNLSTTPKTTQGLTSQLQNVDNRYFPVSSDYTVTDAAYKTFNTHAQSSISFKLVLDPDSKNRLDGVNVYFESPTIGTGEGKNGSNIKKVRIGSYTVDFDGSVPLLNTSGQNLLVIDAVAQGTNLSWGDYDMANITFEAFRDARVISTNAPYKSTSSRSNPVSSDFYVESGTQSTFGTPNRNPIWNVPVLTRPSADASVGNVYVLSGGVINIVDGPAHHVITWPTAKDTNNVSFTYDLAFLKNGADIPPGNGNSYENQGGNSYVIPIDPDNVAKYTIEVRKVFNGSTDQPELSQPDILEFYSVKVETSGMNLSVQNPSNTSSVTLSWNAPAITGNSIIVGGSELALASHVIYLQYVKYRTTSSGTNFSGEYSRLYSSGPAIEGPSLYTLPNTTLGTLYEFIMYIEARVKYTLNNAVQDIKSEPHNVPFTPQTPTYQSQYIVSTVPSVAPLPHSTPVLTQTSPNNPTLLLDLDAKGLEYEGFVSTVVILTQDGTAEKPEGEQALLIFPNPNNNEYNTNRNPAFSFANNVTGVSGAGAIAGDTRLAGGDSATSTPINVSPSVLSTQDSNNNYKLTIGTTNPSFEAGTWINSNVAQLGGVGAPKLSGSSNNIDSDSSNAWSFSEATWVSTVINSNGTRTATYTGGFLTSNNFTGPVTIRTTYGVNANEIPNTDIRFSIIDNTENPVVIFSSITSLDSLVVNAANKTIRGTIPVRYGLSTLEMPSTANSGFVSGYPVNYMVILTTRRGTDIGVGEFTYQADPQVSNVQIVTENGQHWVQFNISNA